MTEIATTRQKALTIRTLLYERKAELQLALPRHLTADRMLRLTMTAIQRNPRLLDCTQASLIGSIMQAAQLGLEIDLLGHAYLVPFKNTKSGQLEAQLIPGYKGLMDLARRSGEVADIEAKVVREGDLFEYEYGSNAMLKHRPARERGELTHVWCIAWLRGHDKPHFEVMSQEDVEKIRERSRAKDAGPWKTDYDAMALKSVIRQTCKQLPARVELKTAIALDEQVDIGIAQELPSIPELPEAAPAPQPEPPKRRGRKPRSEDGGKTDVGTPGVAPPREPPSSSPGGPAPYDASQPGNCPECDRTNMLVRSHGHRDDCSHYDRNFQPEPEPEPAPPTDPTTPPEEGF